MTTRIRNILFAIMLCFASKGYPLEIIYPADHTYVTKSNYLIIKGGENHPLDGLIIELNEYKSELIDISGEAYRADFGDMLVVEPVFDVGENLVKVNGYRDGEPVAQASAEIFYQAYKNPEQLEGSSLDRVQHLMLSSYNNFQSVHLAHEAGLLPDDIYEIQRVGVGFAFSSGVGLDLIDIMRVSAMGESLWDVVKASAEEARAYCLNPQNRCVSRYEAARQAD